MINAMIFAAGQGSRLKPLTSYCPKALVRVAGKPLLEMALRKMEGLGVQKTVVNVHHHSSQIFDFLKTFHSPKMEVLISDEPEELLDTGGGLLKARGLFDPQTPILIFNVDIITNADLKAFIDAHLQGESLASLMVKSRKASRYLLFDEDMQLAGWRRAGGDEEILIHPEQTLKPFGFQGIHIVNPAIFELMDEQAQLKFPIVPFYLKLARNYPVMGRESPDATWFDIGTPQKLARAEAFLNACSEKDLRGFME